ncbi:MAG TPA: undecaprenyl-diphosphatase UppP [Pirellulales bacterium]|jgi:undecaprenyl-diphosphatase|nr:undecaprenyl-diphosphatase UppP [Pirellulales bacterium]
MHDFWQAVVLGVVQGLTEFLPISSTAHLRIVPALLGWPDPGAAFSAVVQCGTLVAVIAYFRRDLTTIIQAVLAGIVRGRPFESFDARLGWMMVFGAVPIMALGLLLKDLIESELRSLYVIAGALAGLALLLMLAEWLHVRAARQGNDGRQLTDVNWGDAITVGLCQAMALVPGSSRSGVTIMGGLFRGLSREAAARFSFLLSLPAIFAAGMYQLVKERDALLVSSEAARNLLVSTVVAGVVGYAAIAFLLHYLRRHSTYLFIVYRLLLAALLVVLLQSGRIEPSTGEELLPPPAAASAD